MARQRERKCNHHDLYNEDKRREGKERRRNCVGKPEDRKTVREVLIQQVPFSFLKSQHIVIEDKLPHIYILTLKSLLN